MVKLFYTTYISVDPAYNEIVRVKVGKGGIKYIYLEAIKSVLFQQWFKSKATKINLFRLYLKLVWPGSNL